LRRSSFALTFSAHIAMTLREEREETCKWVKKKFFQKTIFLKKMQWRKKATCLYDELFSFTNAKDAIEIGFANTLHHINRHYRKYMQGVDKARIRMIKRHGSVFVKVFFVLCCLAHNVALRKQIEYDAVHVFKRRLRKKCERLCQPFAMSEEDQKELTEIRKKIRIFSTNVLAIKVRSLYVSPFTENSIKRIVLTAVEWCVNAWVSNNSAGLEHLCRIHSSVSYDSTAPMEDI
jgi:hypothetical protein